MLPSARLARFVIMEEKGEYSIGVGIRRRSGTGLREIVDRRMPNSKKGKYVVTGRPGQTSFTCHRVAQGKRAEMTAEENEGHSEAQE